MLYILTLVCEWLVIALLEGKRNIVALPEKISSIKAFDELSENYLSLLCQLSVTIWHEGEPGGNFSALILR